MLHFFRASARPRDGREGKRNGSGRGTQKGVVGARHSAIRQPHGTRLPTSQVTNFKPITVKVDCSNSNGVITDLNMEISLKHYLFRRCAHHQGTDHLLKEYGRVRIHKAQWAHTVKSVQSLLLFQNPKGLLDWVAVKLDDQGSIPIEVARHWSFFPLRIDLPPVILELERAEASKMARVKVTLLVGSCSGRPVESSISHGAGRS